MNTEPLALRLADRLSGHGGLTFVEMHAAAAELRRLHAELQRCKQVCAATSEAWREEAALGCDHCNHPMYAAIRCRVCGRVTEPERNFCPRCGKRSTGIHTCTPPGGSDEA